MTFLVELKRRNVIRMAGLYLVGAWLVTQVAATVLPLFGAPDWMARSIIVVLAIGFVPVLIVAWIFELTPDGLKRDAEVPAEQSIAPQTARRMERMFLLLLALALDGDDKTSVCRVPLTSLCDRTGLSRQTVLTTLVNLRLSGIIQLELDPTSQTCVATLILRIG